MAVPEKARVASKVFVLPDGTEQKDVAPNATGLRFKFQNGVALTFNPDSVPESVRKCAMLRGFAEDIGNTYAGAKGDSNAAFESAEARITQLQAGDWYSREGGGGPNLVVLLEAIRRVKAEAGQSFDEAGTRTKLGDKAYREAALNRDTPIGKLVGKHYDTIRLERMQARMAEAAKAAEGVDTGAASVL